MRDDFDLHRRGFGQRGDLHGGAGRKIIGEIFAVDFVHAGEVGEVGEEHGGFHDIRKGQPLVIEDGLDILQHAVGGHLDVAHDEIAVLGVDRDLAGAKQQVADAYGVVVRSEGLG